MKAICRIAMNEAMLQRSGSTETPSSTSPWAMPLQTWGHHAVDEMAGAYLSKGDKIMRNEEPKYLRAS